MEPDHQTAVSEITILPDGRVFVLGASRELLEVLAVLNPEDAGLRQRLEYADITGACGKMSGECAVKISRVATNSCQKEGQL